MELAIPLVAFGGLFILSKNKINLKMQKRFTQMHRNHLPNTNKLVKNYPVLNREELEDTLNKYGGKKIPQIIITILVIMKLYKCQMKK